MKKKQRIGDMEKFYMVVMVGAANVFNGASVSGYIRSTLEEAKQYAAQLSRSGPTYRYIILESVGEVGPPIIPVDFRPHKEADGFSKK